MAQGLDTEERRKTLKITAAKAGQVKTPAQRIQERHQVAEAARALILDDGDAP